LITLALGQVLRSALFGLRRADPVVLVAIGGVLGAAGLAATYLPARWASRLEPADILRTD
jgi:ABC-type lipoprotein release transport system permease subunit